MAISNSGSKGHLKSLSSLSSYSLNYTPLSPVTNCVVFSDGANGSSSTSTSSSTPGGPSFGLGPNIVMGAFSMPVDVVGATQVILS